MKELSEIVEKIKSLPNAQEALIDLIDEANHIYNYYKRKAKDK